MNITQYTKGMKELIPNALYSFKQGDTRRFVAITTIDKIDLDGESFTTQAQDFAISVAQKEMPELRVFHVKGMKIGNADKATRFGKFLVFEGDYDDTPQAKEVDRLVQDPNSGLKQVSAGFSVVEATGRCPCGARLIVGPLGLKAFFKCPKCHQIYKGRALSEVKFTKAKIFDITVTDRPAVHGTAIASFGVEKEFDMLSRDALKERLVSNGFDEALADQWIKSIPDEDLERMKEENAVELFKEALAEAAKEEKAKTGDKPDDDEKGPFPAEMKGGIVTCKCGRRMRVRGGMETKEAPEIEIDFAPLLDQVKELIHEALKEIDIELPDEFGTRLDEFGAELKELKETMQKQVEDAAGEMLDNSSPATRSRLTLRYRSKERDEKPQTKEVVHTGIKDGEGNEYPSLTAQILGEGE